MDTFTRWPGLATYITHLLEPWIATVPCSGPISQKAVVVKHSKDRFAPRASGDFDSSSSSKAWLSQIVRMKRKGMFLLESPKHSFQHGFCLPDFALVPEWGRRWSFLYWNHEISLLVCVHSDPLLILLMLLTAAAFAVSELFLSLLRITLTCDCLYPSFLWRAWLFLCFCCVFFTPQSMCWSGFVCKRRKYLAHSISCSKISGSLGAVFIT